MNISVGDWWFIMCYFYSWQRKQHGYVLRTINYYVNHQVIYVASVLERKML